MPYLPSSGRFDPFICPNFRYLCNYSHVCEMNTVRVLIQFNLFIKVLIEFLTEPLPDLRDSLDLCITKLCFALCRVAAAAVKVLRTERC